MKILICNAGSTSLKFKLWQMPEFTCMASGRVERVGSENAIFQYASGDYSVRREPIPIPDYECGIWVPIRRSGEDSGCEAAGIVSTMTITGIL